MSALKKLNQYGQEFQNKVISLLLTDKKFLINIADGIKSEFFDNESQQWLVDTTLKYYKKYHTIPTKDFIESSYKKLVDTPTSLAIKQSILKCYKLSSESISDKVWIESEFKEFCLNQSLKQMISESVDLLEQGDYDAIRDKLNYAFRLQYEKNLGIDIKRDVESIFREEDRKLIPFKDKALNDLTEGGYGSGDLVLWFGSPGGGKTSFIISQAAHALKMGKKVLHYTLELSSEYTAKKYYAAMMDCEVKKLKKSVVSEYLSNLPGTLKIQSYGPKTASFDTLENHMQQLWIHEEFKPDMVIIDYLDYVKSKTSRMEKKDEIDDVYIQAKAFAKTHEIPVLSPSQANRTAAKSNIIEGDAAAGSYDKIMIADMCFSLARTTKDKNAGIGRLHVMKNRYGTDGCTYLCEIDLARNYINVADDPMTEEEVENADRPTRKSKQQLKDKVREMFD